MKFAAITLFLLSSTITWTQPLVDTTYQIEVTATMSPIVSLFRQPRVPGTVNEASVGYGGFVRGMWHPGRLLAIGLMTGYVAIAEDEVKTASSLYRARLTTIPLQLAISMQKNHVEIGMGIGPYLMLTSIEADDRAPARAQRLELGLTFFGSYVFEVDDRIKIGPELRVLYFRYRGILSLMPSCSIRLDALRY